MHGSRRSWSLSCRAAASFCPFEIAPCHECRLVYSRNGPRESCVWASAHTRFAFSSEGDASVRLLGLRLAFVCWL